MAVCYRFSDLLIICVINMRARLGLERLGGSRFSIERKPQASGLPDAARERTPLHPPVALVISPEVRVMVTIYGTGQWVP
jgi:hypothetical protein